LEALKAILYFAIFDHPLTKNEIKAFSRSTDESKLDKQIGLLLQRGIIRTKQNFFFTSNKSNAIQKRLKGNEMAQKVRQKAIRRANLIYRFPFVRGVGFSGSFSKDYFDELSDVDFFIITTKDRLWVARSLLILFKKVFLLNSKKYFCVNYFISENKLKIQEQNIYTATELVTLEPVFGKDVFNKFQQENNWAYEYFPNHRKKRLAGSEKDEAKSSSISKMIEWLLSKKLGLKLDILLQYLTLRRWMNKFGSFEKDQFKIAFKSTRNVSKHHPQNFQKKVVDKLNEKYIQILEEFNLELEKEYA